jgi:hypothetical protein
VDIADMTINVPVDLPPNLCNAWGISNHIPLSINIIFSYVNYINVINVPKIKVFQGDLKYEYYTNMFHTD